MQCLRRPDHQKAHNNINDERLSNPVSGLPEAADKNHIEQTEQDKHCSQIKRVGIHHKVLSVNSGIGKERHAQNRQNSHQCKAAQLNEHHKLVFSPDYIPFGHGEQCRIDDVIGLSGTLEALIDSQADKEHAAQDRIPRNERHKAKADKQVRQQQCGQLHFFFQLRDCSDR